MSYFGKSQQRPGAIERRRADRTPVDASAIVMTTASRLSAVMVDISAGGAQLSGCAPPQRGRDIQIRIAGHTQFGGVVWRKDETFGVKFEEALGNVEQASINSAIEQAKREQIAASCEVTVLRRSIRSAPKQS